MPYVQTLPIKENIFPPIPNIKPSAFPSRADDVIELAKPEIGIIAPALAILAKLSKTPKHVKTNEINIIIPLA